jgi:hypothetical protein
MGVGDSIMAGISAVAGVPNFKAVSVLSDTIKQNVSASSDKNTSDSVMFNNLMSSKSIRSDTSSRGTLNFKKVGFNNADGDRVEDAFLFKMAISSLRILIIAVMQEKFRLSASSDWEPFIPFANDGGFVNEAFQLATGRSLVTRFASRRIWKGTTPLKFNFNLKFEAYEDAFKEVVAPVTALLAAVLPSQGEKKSWDFFGLQGEGSIPLLIPPGPDPFGRGMNEKNRSNIAGFGGGGLKNVGESDYISVTVGNHFIFENLIIHTPSVEYDSKLDVRGYPISAEVHLELETYEIYTKQALMQSIL